jgi:N-acetylglutamate synthase-like GNAT family acetyltransferase
VNLWRDKWRLSGRFLLAKCRHLVSLFARKDAGPVKQLKMFRPIEAGAPVSDLLVDGYKYVGEHASLHEPWISLINQSGEFKGLGTWTEETLQKTIIRSLVPRGAVLVEHGRDLVACSSICQSPESRKVGVLMYILVRSDHRKMGLGNGIIHRSIRICQEIGLHELRLLTDEERLMAIRLYFRTGFLPDVRGDRGSEIRWSRVIREMKIV